MVHPRHFPKIIAHRGFCKQHIENTIPALTAAIAAKAEMVEMDVHETHDGQFIVHHDDALADDTPPFRNLTYDQIQRLTGNDGRAPRLSDCLEAIGSMPVDLEIKGCINVANLAEELKALSPAPGSLVSSFDFSLLKRLGTQRVGLPLFLLITISIRQALAWNIRSIGLCMAPRLLPDFLDGVAVDHRFAHKMFIKTIRQSGSKMLVWTVNKRKQMEKFIARGVDGIITDHPDLLLKLLNPSLGM